MSNIIRTTAKISEAEGPVIQQPIIQIDGDRCTLPNTIRASLDSGRDNPFRPDGKIYKSADPIVNFYKIGSNQSRPTSPTESELLLTGELSEKEKKKLKKEKAKKEKKEKKAKEGAETGEPKKPCWRRWFCCCCCCCQSKTSKQVERGEPKSLTQQDNKAKDPKQTKIVVLSTTNKKPAGEDHSDHASHMIF